MLNGVALGCTKRLQKSEERPKLIVLITNNPFLHPFTDSNRLSFPYRL